MEMNCFQLGIRPMFTGLTSPPTMRRRLASPEAETMSYWPPPPPPPVRMSATIWFEDPASLRFTLQPVCLSNGLRHCGSAYPGHSIRLSVRSALPIDVGRFDFLPADFLPPLLPQPAATTASVAVSKASDAHAT